MQKRALGSTGIEVGVVGLGTWGLTGEAYGPCELSVARETLDASFEAGVQLVDFSPAYGPDHAIERLLGQCLGTRPRDSVFLCMRIGVDRSSPKGARKSFNREALTRMTSESLQRLNTDHVDALLLHDPLAETLDSDTQPEAIGTLRRLQEEGFTRSIGVSTSNPDVLQLAMTWGAEVAMVPYNLLLPSLLHEQLGALRKAGVGVLARSPLCYGALAGSWKGDREFAEGDHRRVRWSPEELSQRLRQSECSASVAHKRGCSQREVALRWVLANELVSGIVVGARTPAQARENAALGAQEGPWLGNDELKTLAQQMSEFGIDF